MQRSRTVSGSARNPSCVVWPGMVTVTGNDVGAHSHQARFFKRQGGRITLSASAALIQEQAAEPAQALVPLSVLWTFLTPATCVLLAAKLNSLHDLTYCPLILMPGTEVSLWMQDGSLPGYPPTPSAPPSLQPRASTPPSALPCSLLGCFLVPEAALSLAQALDDVQSSQGAVKAADQWQFGWGLGGVGSPTPPPQPPQVQAGGARHLTLAAPRPAAPDCISALWAVLQPQAAGRGWQAPRAPLPPHCAPSLPTPSIAEQVEQQQYQHQHSQTQQQQQQQQQVVAGERVLVVGSPFGCLAPHQFADSAMLGVVSHLLPTPHPHALSHLTPWAHVAGWVTPMHMGRGVGDHTATWLASSGVAASSGAGGPGGGGGAGGEESEQQEQRQQQQQQQQQRQGEHSSSEGGSSEGGRGGEEGGVKDAGSHASMQAGPAAFLLDAPCLPGMEGALVLDACPCAHQARSLPDHHQLAPPAHDGASLRHTAAAAVGAAAAAGRWGARPVLGLLALPLTRPRDAVQLPLALAWPHLHHALLAFNSARQDQQDGGQDQQDPQAQQGPQLRAARLALDPSAPLAAKSTPAKQPSTPSPSTATQSQQVSKQQTASGEPALGHPGVQASQGGEGGPQPGLAAGAQARGNADRQLKAGPGTTPAGKRAVPPSPQLHSIPGGDAGREGNLGRHDSGTTVAAATPEPFHLAPCASSSSSSKLKLQSGRQQVQQQGHFSQQQQGQQPCTARCPPAPPWPVRRAACSHAAAAAVASDTPRRCTYSCPNSIHAAALSRAQQAVVMIRARGAWATGVIITPCGLLVTNAHLLLPAMVPSAGISHAVNADTTHAAAQQRRPGRLPQLKPQSVYNIGDAPQKQEPQRQGHRTSQQRHERQRITQGQWPGLVRAQHVASAANPLPAPPTLCSVRVTGADGALRWLTARVLYVFTNHLDLAVLQLQPALEPEGYAALGTRCGSQHWPRSRLQRHASALQQLHDSLGSGGECDQRVTLPPSSSGRASCDGHVASDRCLALRRHDSGFAADLDGEELGPGDEVWVVGHGLFGPAAGWQPAVTAGNVAKVVRLTDGRPGMLVTTATVQSGASGGAVLDSEGRLCGLVTSNARHASGATLPHLNFCIPLHTQLQPVLAALLHASTPLQPSLTSPPSPAPPAASTPAAQHSQAAQGAAHTLPAMQDHQGSPVTCPAKSDQAALHAEPAPRSKSTSVGVCGEEGWGALRPGSGGAGAWRGGVGWGGEGMVEAAVEEEEGGPGADEQWRAALVARLQQLDVREEEADRVWALQSPWPPSTATAQPALPSKL